MAIMGVAFWLEPLGEDMAFSVEYWVKDDDRAAGIENVTVWVENGDCYAKVTDSAGDVVECGHQRPEDVYNKWMGIPSDLRKPVTE